MYLSPTFARTVAPDNAASLQLLLTTPDDDAFPITARQVFDFLRGNDDGRYSSRTKMEVLASGDSSPDTRPYLVTLGAPVAFDEETEVKSGGMLGVGALFPDGKLVLTVKPDMRRRDIGTVLFSSLSDYASGGTLKLWMNVANAPGQHFALSFGLQPTGMNRSGGICYSPAGAVEEDGAEDSLTLRPLVDRFGPPRAPRRRPRVTFTESAPEQPDRPRGGPDRPDDRCSYCDHRWSQHTGGRHGPCLGCDAGDVCPHFDYNPQSEQDNWVTAHAPSPPEVAASLVEQARAVRLARPTNDPELERLLMEEEAIEQRYRESQPDLNEGECHCPACRRERAEA